MLLYNAKFIDLSKMMLNKIQMFWNRVSLRITNSFYAKNILALYFEACFTLIMIKIYEEQIRLMSAVKFVTTIPENNMATLMLFQSFLHRRDFRLVTNQRLAFELNKGGIRLKVWNSKCTTTFQVRLPVDKIAVNISGIFPKGLILIRLTRLLQVTREDADEHFKVKEHECKLMYLKWTDERYSSYYEYRPPSRKCWNFMTLSKFSAGQIDQMRANKSYLNTQTDWSNQDRDPTCPKCKQGFEMLAYIVHSLTLEGDRRQKNVQAIDMTADSGLWKGTKKEMKLLGVFSSYILRNRINFPVKMPVVGFLFTRNAGLAS